MKFKTGDEYGLKSAMADELVGELDGYRAWSDAEVALLIEESRAIDDTRILHINSSPHGGGVAALLYGQVRLERALGLASNWYAVTAPERFFQITKSIHNFLQGATGDIDAASWRAYEAAQHSIGSSLARLVQELSPAIVVIHDPQPMGAVLSLDRRIRKILRLHMDLTTPNAAVVSRLKPLMAAYDEIIVSSSRYIEPLGTDLRVSVIPPAIDPLSEKISALGREEAEQILAPLGIAADRPIVTQVSRFDPWKDPIGVIRAYQKVKAAIPTVQIVLIGTMLAQDDPEASLVLQETRAAAAGDPDIHIFARSEEVGNAPNDRFINALYTASTVMIQKSTREGFGLTITEAMWKAKPVVAGRAEGALLQIVDGETGFIVDSIDEATRALVHLIRDSDLRERIGFAARESVRERFLLPRFVLDNIRLYRSLLER
ncbi:MAG: glycosyltransferase [Candidatus Sungbacteria bacterium]|uniref:Glycosyltransferase n=1 Tax=Candidatus Sungiibacteriota bacterium TaxID=2750080 RepID=A0A932YZ00_9BACT|nr:glycosyltransferase [Candidatus Sungbacteria bacterium]